MTIWIFALKCIINTSWSHLIKEKVTIVLKRNERVNFSADFGANTHDNFVVFSFFTSSCRRTSLFQKDFQIGLGLKNDVWNGWWQRISGPIQLTAALISCVTHYDFFSKLQGVPKSLGNPSLGRLLSFKHVNVNLYYRQLILLTFLDESNVSAQTCLDTL